VGHEEIDFGWLLGKFFIPLAWVIGVPWNECEIVGRLMGTNLILNNFIAFRVKQKANVF
jgi:nucleoside permease NupC